MENEIYSKETFLNFLNENNLIMLDIKGKKLTLDMLHNKLDLLDKKHNVCGNFLILKDKNITELKFRY